MNRQTLQDKTLLQQRVFSTCGIFSVESRIGTAGIRKANLFATVVLPNFGFADEFMPYRIPYEWLIGTRDRAADKLENKGPVSEHSKEARTGPEQRVQNCLRTLGVKVFNQFLVNAGIQNISHINALSNTAYGFSLDSVKKGSENHAPKSCFQKNSAFKQVLGTNPSAAGFSFGIRDIGVSPETQALEIKQTQEGGTGTRHTNRFKTKESIFKGLTNVGRTQDTLTKPVIQQEKVKTDAGHIFHLHRKIIEKVTATATKIETRQKSEQYIEKNSAKTRLLGREVELRQETIQRTIKTFASKSTEEKRENRAQLSSIHAQLKTAEQKGNQDIRHLQQTVSELKSMLSASKAPLPLSLSRPPSLYGRLK